VAESVTFDPAYRDLRSLTRLVQDASVVVLPYESKDQVTSGVLVDAIACGRPVVATAFPHAVELLSTGAGTVVPHGDAKALAAALRRVLTQPGLAASMEAEAERLAPALSWRAVAAEYGLLADGLLVSSESVPV
jgi:polysaccharide biosynthesis protein PslF